MAEFVDRYGSQAQCEAALMPPGTLVAYTVRLLDGVNQDRRRPR